jgi:hypothetical protein
MDKSAFLHWSTNQAYLSLGFAVAAAADLRVGTCPMSGFVPSEVSEYCKWKIGSVCYWYCYDGGVYTVPYIYIYIYIYIYESLSDSNSWRYLIGCFIILWLFEYQHNSWLFSIILLYFIIKIDYFNTISYNIVQN